MSFIYRSAVLVPEHAVSIATSQIKRLSELQQHRHTLTWAIDTAEQRLVIVSPFISVRAIQADELAERIAAAKARRPARRVTMYTNAYLSISWGLLHDYSQVDRSALARAEVKIAAKILNKAVCLDSWTLLEDFFNWLSASRREALARHEVSWFFRGAAWDSYISELVQEPESRVLDTVPR